MALVAISAGAVIVYFGDRLLGVKLELFWGVSTFTPLWVLDLFFVPFLAGIVVSCIYGLGGKIVAHFSPLIVRIVSYYELNSIPADALPDYSVLLPMSYWLLVMIVSVEFAAVGGVVGEILIKRVYGRSPKSSLLHKKYAKATDARVSAAAEQPSKEAN
ncbi:MAG: hypothetical protein FD165_2550 [Gammaproteobacteria bacterium]|nr:MAG: hypothetical protein FD165_2550 [Gammaproteobacteria bacterium]